MHQEIDCARLDARYWQHRFETLEKARQSALVTVRTERDLLRDQLRKADNEVARSKGIAPALKKTLAKGRTGTPHKGTASIPDHATKTVNCIFDIIYIMRTWQWIWPETPPWQIHPLSASFPSI